MAQRMRWVVVTTLVGLLIGCSASDDPDGAAPTVAPPASSITTGGSASDGEPFGTIVVEMGLGDDERLVAVHLGTGEVEQITDEPGYGPRLSPAGGQLAYTRVVGASGEVWVTDFGDEDERVIAGACPAWTPRGLLVADGAGAVDVVTLDGTVLARAVADGPAGGCAVESPRGGFVMSAQTGDLELHRGDGVETLVRMEGCGLGPIGIRSATGTVAFTAACDDDRSGLYVIDEDDDAPELVWSGEAYGAAWSPDGGWLATAGLDADSGEYLLVVVRSDGSDAEVIATPEPVNNPTWGPSRPVA